ncbi:MAG: MCE family protein [Planctomycetes bacterium]|nr:MCE family protein [Planctomycetota bacterium]
MAYSRNEITAGAVITASAVTAAFMVYYVGNFKNIFEEKEDITVFFKSVSGLKPGDPVLYAGIDAGNVKEIRTAEVKTSAITLDAFAQLPDAERFVLSKPRLPVLCTKEGTGDIYTVDLPLPAIRKLIRMKGFTGLEQERDFLAVAQGNGHVFIQQYQQALVDILVPDSMSEGEARALLGADNKPPEDRRETRVAVVLRLPQRYAVHRNSQVRIDKTLTGNLSVVVSQGWGHVVGKDEVLVGDELSFFDKIAVQVEGLTSKIGPLVDDVHKTVIDVRATIAHVNDVTVKEKIDPALDKINTGLEDLKGILAENRPTLKTTIDNAKEAVDNLKAATADAKDVLAQNKDKIAGTLQNIEEMSVKMNKAGDAAQEILAKVNSLGDKVNGIVDENRRNIERTVANLKTLSDDAAAAVADIRRHPWRLLVKPDEEDVNTLNVYDAARDYNKGATALNSALLDMLAYLEAHPQGTPADTVRLKDLTERLETSLGKFDAAENHFWETINGGGGNPGTAAPKAQ